MKLLFFLLVQFYLVKLSEIENPYRVLKVAPYYSMTDIKKAYKEMIKLNHPDKIKGNKQEARKNFERIQNAYEELKKSSKKDGGGLKGALSDCFHSILTFFTVLNICYYVLKSLPRIIEIIFGFVDKLYYVLRGSLFTYCVIDSFFPHYFDEENMKYLASGGIPLLLSLLFKEFFFPTKKKKTKKLSNEEDEENIENEEKSQTYENEGKKITQLNKNDNLDSVEKKDSNANLSQIKNENLDSVVKKDSNANLSKKENETNDSKNQETKSDIK